MGFLEHPSDQRGVSSLSNAVHLQHFAFGVCLSPSWPPAALNALMLLPGPIIIINACPVIINKVHPPRIRERERTRKTAISWHCVRPGKAGKARQGSWALSANPVNPANSCCLCCHCCLTPFGLLRSVFALGQLQAVPVFAKLC